MKRETVKQIESMRDELEYLAASDYPAAWVARDVLKAVEKNGSAS